MNTTSSIHVPKLLVRLALAAALIVLPAAAAGQPVFSSRISPAEEGPGEPVPVIPGWPGEMPGLACTHWRWIGIMAEPSGSCPIPEPGDDWRVRRLFFDPEAGEEILPFGLSTFCLYEHPESGGLLTVDDVPGLEAIDRDCLAVQPVAPVQPVLLEMAAQQLEARFLRFAGVAQARPLTPPRVRLALLDTAPTSEDPTDNADNVSPHGYTLASMARRLACLGNACVAKVTSQLALGRMSGADLGNLGPPDQIQGGEVGTIGDLAEAIRKEVKTWERLGRQQTLILNLSLGWRGQVFGGLESDLSAAPASVQAVHAALRDAVCRGVSVLAAAGNQSWGPDPQESHHPLLPAAWEARRAPSTAVCQKILIPDQPAAGGGTASYRPLIYAVGGVRADGRTLENSRLEAEPRLVAFGDHGVVVGRDGRATAMLTGSSVSTLVAASALAWVRYLLPGLSSFAAMDRLYTSGVPLGRRSRFPAPRPVRRVDVGSAARRACQECSGAGCAALCSSSAIAQTFPVLPVFPPMSDVLERAFKGATRVDVRKHLQAAKPPNKRSFDTNVQVSGTGPQPGSNPCTTCVFGPGGGATAAYIQIDPDYRGDLSSAVLQVDGAAYFLGNLKKEEKIVVEGLPPDPGRVQLSFQVGSLSATSLFFVPE